MADHLTKKKRSWNMSRIKSKNTKPELIVRSLLHGMGYRFRLHRKDLPGKPDIVLPKYKVVIFVHGCFWHRHKGCRKCTTPSSNQEYWKSKFERNVANDKCHKVQLRGKGWKVFVIWECETNNLDNLQRKCTRILTIKRNQFHL
jgi:DNA mismatch endonuclease (patch repair protein)